MTTGKDVRAMYELYPYPSSHAGKSLISDLRLNLSVLFPDNNFTNKKILDAGCGTGHRFVATARQYPSARFVGVDFSEASLGIAKQLADQHGIDNATFRQADILDLDIDDEFDIIISTGVIHHLEDPERGLRNLCDLLSPSGIIIIWLYHPLGEHQRILDREFIRAMLGDGCLDEVSRAKKIMKERKLNLDKYQYGLLSIQRWSEVCNDSLNVDAFLHPILHTYRFNDALALFADCDVQWAALDALSIKRELGLLIDLSEIEKEHLERYINAEKLFESDDLKKIYRELNPSDKLKIIELALKPNGFTVLAGKNNSYGILSKRIEGNLKKM